MKDADKISYCLLYNGITKCYATLEQIENDKDLPKDAHFNFTKRGYSPAMKLWGFTLYSDSF